MGRASEKNAVADSRRKAFVDERGNAMVSIPKRRLFTPEEYLQIARQPDNRWLFAMARGLESAIYIASLDCTLLLSEVYDKITFETGEEER
jgi:hypothetical protein